MPVPSAEGAPDMIEIDGSQGEGGGQVLRTSLSLSAITGQPFRLHHIRAGRKNPGLQRQHLTCVRAAAEICQAELRGAAWESSDLTFRPGAPIAGNYRFDIGTAGSTSLVLQTVLPILFRQEAPSTVTLEGGTHNDKAPPWDFLNEAFLPVLERIGPRVATSLDRPGYYPKGGGLVRFAIEPSKDFRPLEHSTRGALLGVTVKAVVSRLRPEIAEREVRTAARLLREFEPATEVEEETRSPGPGNVVLIRVRSERATELFSACGARGVPAEQVARSAADEVLEYLRADVPVGRHLADQLLLPLAIGAGGRFRTLAMTEHTRTNIEVIRRFLDVPITVAEGDSGATTIEVGR